MSDNDIHLSQLTQAPSTSSKVSTLADPTLWGSLLPWGSGPEGVNLGPMYFRRPQRRYTIGCGAHHDFLLPGIPGSLCAIEWDGDESSGSAVTFTNLSNAISTSINGERVAEATCRLLHHFSVITFLLPEPGLTRLSAGTELSFSFRRNINGTDDNEIPPEVRDKYDIQRTLGSGAYATVVKALHVTEHQFYAIKLFHKNVFNAELRDGLLRHRVHHNSPANRLRKEIDVLSTLRHKNIVEFKEAIYGTRSISIVMELVSGGDLGTYLNTKGNISESESKHFASQICDALAYLHNAGIAHRDLKPENVLLTSDQPRIAKLADFGMSKIVSSMTALRTQCGTPLYMAPEISQQSLQGYDYVVDSWSLGVMLYMMLVGRSPFTAHPSKAVDWRQLAVVKLSPDGISFLAALLCANPRHRMSSTSACRHQWLSPSTARVATEAEHLYLRRRRSSAAREAIHHVIRRSADTPPNQRSSYLVPSTLPLRRPGFNPRAMDEFRVGQSTLLMAAPTTIPERRGPSSSSIAGSPGVTVTRPVHLSTPVPRRSRHIAARRIRPYTRSGTDSNPAGPATPVSTWSSGAPPPLAPAVRNGPTPHNLLSADFLQFHLQFLSSRSMRPTAGPPSRDVSRPWPSIVTVLEIDVEHA
ncbi:kinase-like domain-containing protein [Earliella scabrosa]|nr:kinase-like domain-containing protein [Earliella scabrosa]